ncbi:MAG: prolipoprotein diacylglyceryl transferase, partial [Coriobacteriales bacterium]|nr:prolipoprotein diacylglyceryl transferase [Coriobacteriales bacterium]
KLLLVVALATIGIILGGRLGYVLFYDLAYYSAHPEKILAFAEGGMSFHGGVIGMAMAIPAASWLSGIPLLTLGDLAVITAPVGIFLVRCANFINGELWGSVTTLPWGVVFNGGGFLPRHPTQLYEALLEGAVMFFVLYSLACKNPPLARGTFVGIFMVLYGSFRIAVEFVRQPDAHIGYLAGGWLTMGIVLSIPLIIAGAGFLLFAHFKKLPQVGVCDANALPGQILR